LTKSQCENQVIQKKSRIILFCLKSKDIKVFNKIN
jgi:hypothetical protein